MQVPIPLLVNISKSKECSSRPSIICAFLTPPLNASIQASTFGTIPPTIVPSFFNSSVLLIVKVFIKFFSLSRTPGVSVKNRTFLASSATATLLAAKSALILNPGQIFHYL